ncbi:hypothetical protein WJX73_007443 [Symbiochloris irregularis]|uniref:Uncharacterized protein n=1 Tax=Symbiochloris irregularis TaxID=706552 RepID=A0AAW1PZ99_9CHLO
MYLLLLLVATLTPLVALGQSSESICSSCAKVPASVRDAFDTALQVANESVAPALAPLAGKRALLAPAAATAPGESARLPPAVPTSSASTAGLLGLPGYVGAQSVLYWDAGLPEFQNTPGINLTEGSDGSIESGPVVVAGSTISRGYVLPRSKQGINDQRFFIDQGLSYANQAGRKQRYAALMNQINPGVPSNATEKARMGMALYHCYSTAYLKDTGNLLALDAANNIESAVIMWGAPSAYQNPGCLGNGQGGKQACVPRADAIPAWRDYAILLVSQWQGGSAGRFTHFIVWNEVDSPDWYDMSPEVDDIGIHIENTPAADVYVGRYVLMLKAVHDAVAQNLPNQPTMVYVPMTRMWTASPWCPGPRWSSRCNIGASNFLNLLWSKVGTSFDWSLAVHAYGIPTSSDWGLREPYQAYTFSDLPKVRDFQLQWLRTQGVQNPDSWPQAILAASEQGWSTGDASQEATAAQYICFAHAVATTAGSNIAWVTHHDSQDVYGPYPASYGLMALADGVQLNPSNPSPCLLAYRATNVNVWGLDPNNYCCRTWELGCNS